MAGQAGKPLSLASTRSPTFHCRQAAAAAAALLPPFLRLGAIRESQTTATIKQELHRRNSGDKRLGGRYAQPLTRLGTGFSRHGRAAPFAGIQGRGHRSDCTFLRL